MVNKAVTSSHHPESELWFMRQSIEKMGEALILLQQIAARQDEAQRGFDRRMALVEEATRLLREEIQKKEEKTAENFKPIQKHVDLVNSLCKIFTASVGTVGSLLTIWKVLAYFSGHPTPL